MTEPKEGYIKFNCIWMQDDPLDSVKLRDLIFWRNRLFKSGLIGVYPDGIGFGNISCRLRDSFEFIVSGTQTGHLEYADENHFCLINQFDLGKNEVHCIGPVKASSESMTHAACYISSDEIKVVMHVHHKQLWQRLKNVAPTSSSEISYGSPRMAMEVKHLIQSQKMSEGIIVMAGHEDGIIVIGKSFASAFQLLEREMGNS